MALTNASDRLVVRRNEGDRVFLGGTWTPIGKTSIDGVDFDSFRNSSAVVLLQQLDVGNAGDPVFIPCPNVFFEVEEDGAEIIVRQAGGQDIARRPSGETLVIEGTNGPDRLAIRQRLTGLVIVRVYDGDDRVDGRFATSPLMIDGGGGSDTVFGGSGDDVISQTVGDAVCPPGLVCVAGFGPDGNDSVNGGLGNDRIVDNRGENSLNGNGGDDTVLGGSNVDIITGGRGHDRLDGRNGEDVIRGDDGADTVIGGGGNDRLQGNGGADLIRGGDGNDVIEGDRILITHDDDEGHDTIFADGGDDVVNAGDVIGGLVRGGDGNDRITGGTDHDSSDFLWGDAGNDHIEGRGSGFNDNLRGNDGHDTLINDGGLMSGGTGDDTFRGNGMVDIYEVFDGQLTLTDAGSVALGADSFETTIEEIRFRTERGLSLIHI